MTGKKQKEYEKRVESLTRLTCIADVIVQHSKSMEDFHKERMLEWNKLIRNLVQHPEPQHANLKSLQSLENDFLTWWNEGYGPEVELFWMEIKKAGFDYERKDILKDVLKRKKIKNREEYDLITDVLTAAKQNGRINNDEFFELSKLIGEFEAKKKK